jgi:hypothetical protein
MKRHRKYDDMPDVTDNVKEFGDAWWKWWIGLQPDWRGGSELLTEPPEGFDWGELEKGGQNGLFLLLLSLGWWGAGASDQSEEASDAMAHAYESFGWALSHILATRVTQELPQKRASDVLSEGSSKRWFLFCCVYK